MVSIKTLFENTEFQIPHPKSNFDYRQFLIDKIQKVEADLKEILHSKNYTILEDELVIGIEIYTNYKEQLIKSLNSYFNGKTDISYTIFSGLLDKIKLDGFTKIPKSTIKINEKLYRIRSKIENTSSISRKDIFHLPNSLRRKVSNQRYSIAGYPCLYLTNSIYCAWEELEKPSLDDCYFSKFKIDPVGISSNFIDLSKQNYYKLTDPTNESEILKKILFFPIIFSCSIKLENRNDGFFPEYIFSQFVTRWCKENADLRGIIYTSSRVHNKSTGTFLNYAIPIMDEYTNSAPINELCNSTRDLLSCTEPFKISSLDPLPTTGTKNDNAEQIFLDTLYNSIDYEQTIFSKIENQLDSKPIGKP